MIRSIFLLPALLFIISTSYAAKITGIITDNEGKLLPYASIFIKGTTRGTNANSEGRYSLNLEPGQYTLVCQHVGYKKEERTITVSNAEMEIDFKLSLQDMLLGEVIIKNGEDPAYAIIRNAIKKRTYYQGQPAKFQCEVYTKGQMKVRNYPKKIFGQKVDFEDGDTSKQKILYLSETISVYSVEKPNKEKIEVISSKVSGQSNGFGLSAPRFISFYDNNVFIGENLNPRGFISPISDNALNFYRYKLEGSFFEDGREIDHIKVIPKRKYEPLFSGYINIVADEWRIHAVQLLLTKESQMELIDTLRIEQLYRPLEKDVWFVSSQVIYPAIKILGFDAYGSFVNVYSNFNTNPAFNKKTFNNTILKYTDSSNKKTPAYWEKARPVPLMADEVSDYKRKDSLELARKNPRYLDSLNKVRNKPKPVSLLLLGQTFINEKKRTAITIRSLEDQFNYNIVEGFVINTGLSWSKRIDSNSTGRRSITFEPNLRYGFTNKHFATHLTGIYRFGKKYANTISLSGGKRIFQFNNYSPIGDHTNTVSTLFSRKNLSKIYEAWYLRGSYIKGIGSGTTVTGAFQYQDRLPLENRTDYSWVKNNNRVFTPNYPNELVSQNIIRHQVLIVLLGIRWQPGSKYIELPERKINIGSKYPVFSLQYTQAIKGLLGNDADFSKWKFTIREDINLHLLGRLSYRLGIGGFINNNHVEIPDYFHFNGNQQSSASEYLNSFQLLPYYQFSNTAKFYALGHIEHHFNGFLTNKIPGFRKLNWYLVAGANAFYLKDNNYQEYFIGLENIFKQFRVDWVQSYLNGQAGKNHIRIGFRLARRTGGDDWP